MRDYVQRRVVVAKNIEPMLGESSARLRKPGRRCEKCAGPMSSYNLSRKCYACLAAVEKRAPRSVEAVYKPNPRKDLCSCGERKQREAEMCGKCYSEWRLERECRGCGQIFIARTKRSVWCHESCRQAHRNRSSRRRAA